MRNTIIIILAQWLFLAAVQAKEPGSMASFIPDQESRSYTMTTAKGIVIKVSFRRDDVFRIQMAPNGNFDDPENNPAKAQIIVDRTPAEVAVTVTQDTFHVEFQTDKLTLRMLKKDCQFDLLDEKGQQVWREIKPVDIGTTSTVQTLETSLDECFVGGGQQNGYFTHKGTKIDIEADGNWHEGGKPNPAPFYMSNKGYGVLRHTFSTGTYDFSGNETIELTHHEKRFDAYYFIGDSFNRILELYTQFTGRPNFVPIWALEFGEADAYMTRDKKTKEPAKDKDGHFIEITPDVISRLAEKYRKYDMPCGWISPNDGYGCGYVELERVVRSLADLGFYTGLWTENGLKNSKYEVAVCGTRARKLDVAWTGPAYQFALDACKQAWESLVMNSDTRGFVWTVQGWAGTQRYAVCWTGDQYGSWDLIRYHIPTLIGSGLSGQAYATTDVDGIFGGSPETYTRDLQWKCFTPVLYAMNGWAGKMNKSPWAYEEPYRSINRDYLKLKMRLTPYIYKYAREAYDTGAPIVRGMLWNYPQDKKTWDRSTQHQYMLGDWLLVAPVYTSMKACKGWRREDIYLPSGRWIDYWDGRRVDGPMVIDDYPITLEKLPLLVKAGAIIPMYPSMLYNNQKPKDPLTFAIYPYGESQFEMYEDDGLTRKHQTGEFARQMIKVSAPKGNAGDIQVSVGKSEGSFDGKLSQRVYQFEIHSELKPRGITVDGRPLLELTDPGAYEAAVAAWTFDSTNRRGIVYAKLPRLPTDKSVTVLLDIDEKQQIAASPPYPKPVSSPVLEKLEFTVTANSQNRGSLKNAFDSSPETFWQSNTSLMKPKNDVQKPPFIIDIGLNGLYAVNGLQYLARQDLGKGLIKDVEVYVSKQSDKLGDPVYKGSFAAIKDLQTAKFPTKWGSYVRVKVLNSHKDQSLATAAEFDVLQDLEIAPLPDEEAYLSDLEPAQVKGKYRKDLSVGGKSMFVNSRPHKKGLGVSAPSELTYKIDGTWDRLTGNVGVDDEVGDGGSVMFRVYGDGKLIFESPRQSGKSVKQLMDLDIKGVKELRLSLLDGDDGNENDHGDWIDTRLIRRGSQR